MKRLLAIILVALLTVTMAVGVNGATYSGTCGTSLTWTFNSTSGVFKIVGSGEMGGYSTIPWGKYKSSIKSVLIGNGVTCISASAFYNCPLLTTVSIPNSVTKIYGSAFSDCTSLTKVAIPDSVTSIANYAFYNCTGLTHVTIGDGVTSIGGAAFYGCTSLKQVVIGKSVNSIGYNAFARSYSISDVYYCGTRAQWKSISIDSTNFALTANPTIHYYSETVPTDTNRSYWHYVDGVPTVWSIECTNHTYGSWTSYSDTQHKRTCSKCSNTEYGDHNWDEGVITTPATTISTGEKLFTCTLCGATKKEVVPMLPPSIPGDVNGDGVINIMDVLRLAKFVAGWDIKLY